MITSTAIKDLQYYSLERIRHRAVEPATLQALAEFSREVSPPQEPDWWLELLRDGRREFPGLPRGYLDGGLPELLREVQLHQECRATIAWGAARVVNDADESDPRVLCVDNAPWGLRCDLMLSDMPRALLLALLRAHGYRLPATVLLPQYSGQELRKLDFAVDLWIGDRPTLSAYSVARFLNATRPATTGILPRAPLRSAAAAGCAGL